MNVLVTGATGFVGQSVLQQLSARPNCTAIGATRNAKSGADQLAACPDLSAGAGWRAVLRGHDVVVHAAARVHLMDDGAADPLAAYRAINVEGTLRLAQQAADEGVRRFVFLSSVKVHGELTDRGHAFHADSPLAPADPYGVSKAEAEQRLLELADRVAMEVVIIRPPLVYGPGVRANFLTMMRWLARGVPLPLGAIQNRRSLVSRGNLVDLIVTCVDHPAAANQAFLVSDGEDLSTPELLRRLARAMGTTARLVPVPPSVLKAGAALAGKRAIAKRLCGSLQVDISDTSRLLGWTPPNTVDEGLQRVADWYRDQERCGVA